MTEEEARKKDCAFRCMLQLLNQAIFASVMVLDSAKMAASGKCIASDCMMWRWIPCVVIDADSRRTTPLEYCDKDGNFLGEYVPSTKGYCGLAGKL